MAKKPWCKWYFADWLSDSGVRAVSLAARGLWMDLLGLMDSSPRRGELLMATGDPMPVEMIARLTGTSVDEVTACISELTQSGTAARLDGDILACRRMLRERDISDARSEAGRAGMAARWKDDNKSDNKPIANGITNGITASASAYASASDSSGEGVGGVVEGPSVSRRENGVYGKTSTPGASAKADRPVSAGPGHRDPEAVEVEAYFGASQPKTALEAISRTQTNVPTQETGKMPRRNPTRPLLAGAAVREPGGNGHVESVVEPDGPVSIALGAYAAAMNFRPMQQVHVRRQVETLADPSSVGEMHVIEALQWGAAGKQPWASVESRARSNARVAGWGPKPTGKRTMTADDIVRQLKTGGEP